MPILKPFNMKNLPKLLNVVKDSWSMVKWEEDCKTLDVEFILRNNIFQNKYALQLEDNKEILAAAFAAKKDEINNAKLWLEESYKNLSQKDKESLALVSYYLDYMDKKTFSFMGNDDIKLTLFISLKSGFGKKILSELFKILKDDGFSTVYLWTDSDCNCQWYPKNNFTLVSEEVYPQFSTDTQEFRTFIYKKDL